MSRVELYVSSSVIGGRGPGGYGVLIVSEGEIADVKTGNAQDVAAPRMLLAGLHRGLLAINHACELTVICASSYVTDAISNRWLEKWKRYDWCRNAKRDPVLNVDLWKQIESRIVPAKTRARDAETDTERELLRVSLDHARMAINRP